MDPQWESPASTNYTLDARVGEEGWPLGLGAMHVLNMGTMASEEEIGRDREFIDPLYLATSSFSSLSCSSSDFDTQSSRSFFHDRSVTLGSLIGLRCDRSARYGGHIIDPEKQVEKAIVSRRAKGSYGIMLRPWKSLKGCMNFTSRLQSTLCFAHLLKADKGDRVRKVYMNAMYDESEGVSSDGNNPSSILNCHKKQSTSIGVISQRRLHSLDLETIEESSSMDNDGKDWNICGLFDTRCRHNRAESRSLCLPFVSNMFVRMISCKG